MARPREPWKRERLLSAALSIAERDGASALSIKRVAEVAEVSPATVHYHFADVGTLVFEVIDTSLEQMCRARLDAISSITALPEKLARLIELGVPDELTPEIRFLYESVTLIRSREAYVAATRSYVERQVSLYRSVIDAGIAIGAFTVLDSSDTIARNLLALEDAYCLYLSVGVARDGVQAREGMRSYASAALGTVIAPSAVA